MAKSKKFETPGEHLAELGAGVVVPPPPPPPPAPPALDVAKLAEAPKPAGPKWQVSLSCPTPLAHPSMEVEATSPEDAKRKFCEANGIADSVHQWSVRQVA